MSSLIPGCVDKGDGACPVGEICSSQAPAGLEFSGPQLSDDDWLVGDPGVKTTAVGGRQTIGVYDHATGAATPDAGTARFVGDALAVSGVRGSDVEVGGAAPGAATLALRDAAGALLDRIELDARPVAAVDVRAVTADHRTIDPRGRVAVWDGATDVALTVALHAPDGARVVDEAMIVTRRGGALTRRAWDAVAVAVVDGDVVLDITAGELARPVEVTVPAVRQLDAATADMWLTDVHVHDPQVVCFHGDAGGAEVLGVPWTIAIDGPAVPGDADAITFGNCRVVDPIGVGPVTVTGAAGGVSVAIRFDVAPAPDRPGREIERSMLPRTPGERAE